VYSGESPVGEAVGESRGTDERYTPGEVLDVVRAAFGGSIWLDPCCGPLAPRDHVAWTVYGGPPGKDGLAEPWESTVFVNPPYSRGQIALWVEKIVREAGRSGANGIIALLPQDLGTRWGQRVLETADALAFWRGRITFGSPSGPPPAGAKQPSVFAYWGSDFGRFRRAFAAHAGVVRL
jgi:hypothetical protein